MYTVGLEPVKVVSLISPRIQVEALTELINIGLFEVSCLKRGDIDLFIFEPELLYHIEGCSGKALTEGL